jgi:uncharacterized membrane protein
MAERPSKASSLVKHAAGIAKPVTKQIESTVKTVAKEATPKVASSAAKSAVSGGLNALKDAGGQVLGKGGQSGEGKSGKSGKGGSGAKVKVTNIIEEVDIGAPRQVVYDQWTRFQEFPSFMKKVQSTDQLGDEKVRWKAKIFWSTRTWESTIIEQIPDERIVWRSTGAKGYVDGAVTFHELASNLTKVLLVLEYHPHGFMEKTGNLWRAQGRRVRLELKHFRRHVMSQVLLHPGEDVDGWRGEIHDGKVATSDESGKSDEQTGDKRRRTSRSTASSSDTKSTRSGSRSSSGSSTQKDSSEDKSSGGRSSSAEKAEKSSASKASSGEKSSASKTSGTRRSSGTRKSTTSGRSSGGSGSKSSSSAERTADAEDE